VAIAAGVIAVMAKQSDSAIAAAVADQYSAMFTETGPDPLDTKVLDVTIAAHDFECGGGKPQIGEIGIFEAHVEFIDLAVVARDDLAQVVDIDCRH